MEIDAWHRNLVIHLCIMPEITVQQMDFGGRRKADQPKHNPFVRAPKPDKKIHKTLRLSPSVLKDVGNRPFTEFIENCYLSSKTVQPGSCLRTNYDRLQTCVASIVADDLLQPSMKNSAIMSVFSSIAENGDNTRFIASIP